MECNKESKEVEFLGEHFRISYYHGPNIVKLEEFTPNKRGKFSWKQIYIGHTNLLTEVVEFAKSKREHI